MKKIFALFLCAILLVSVVACGSSSDTTSPKNTNEEPAPPSTPDPQPAPPEIEKELYQGFGLSNSARKGPGQDDKEVSVYSINEVYANALFDKDGKIVSLYLDQLEVATPNYDGESMPHLSGFPGQGGYNNDENHDGKVDGKTSDTPETFIAEIDSWKTKRERGDAYMMTTAPWHKQADAYQKLFTGKTVDEIQQWFKKYTSDVNGRPLKADASAEEDKAKFNNLTDAEKAQLAELTASATISLNDSHGNIIQAITSAYENRIKVEDSAAVASMGFGLDNSGRKGPGQDDKEVPVYSINQVFANTLFDKDGKIVSLYLDQLEVATPNYDGESMPHFSGFPGQGGYNNDENHDGKVDGKTSDTPESFIAEVDSWKTKRQRGDAYMMTTAPWYKQADAYQQLFVGMTADEVQQWFDKYTSDVNGRPLKADATAEEDKVKFNALTDAEKAQLADLVTSATISLNDSHGDIIQAIKSSFENSVTIN